MTSVAELPDRAEREAIAGATAQDRARTMFVDAGAGTGKTTALVGRVVNLVAAGADVRRIAAITFTEAAAGELRHRVRTRLEHATVKAHEAGDQVLAQRLDTALADLDAATFSTLHAFAYGILLDHPLQAGLPPELSLLTDVEASAAFDRRWDAWLASFVDRPEVAPALAHMDLLGLTIPRLRRLAEALQRDLHRIPADVPTPPGPYEPPDPDLDPIRSHLEVMRTHADDGAAIDPDDKLVLDLQGWCADGQAVCELVDGGAELDEVFAALRDLQSRHLARGGTKGVWGEQKQAVADTRKRLRTLVQEVFDQQADHLLRAMAGWVADLLRTAAVERHRRGTLVFDDLPLLARDLVRDRADVRRAVAGRFDQLLIDEFQDTDTLQIELAVLLTASNAQELADAADPATGAIPWPDGDVPAGRLFLVGDPKQSIYRFRGADIAVYESSRAFVDGNGEVRSLSTNFRSVPGVVDWVNEVFRDLMRPTPLAQPDYQQLTAHRPRPDEAGVPVQWFGGPQDLRAQHVRVLEASEVVGVIQQVVGNVEVEDQDSGQRRPARAGDIAVLVRRHATARELERVFDEASLPLVVESRSLVFGTDEVRDLTTILTAIEEPTDQVALLGALRHPSLGCSDVDLLDWQGEHRGWDLPEDPDTDERAGRVGGALRRLARLRALRDQHTVGAFVEHVIDDLHLMELALGRPRYRDRWRRIRFVADQAHAYHVAGGHLRGFVRWLREQAEEGLTRREHVVPDPDDDAVRITTVHASKGLEYPVVIVLGLDTGTIKPVNDPVVLWDPEGGFEVNIGSDLKTSGYARLLNGDVDVVGSRAHHTYEEQRLLYVATTRARDHLVVSLHHAADNKAQCHAEYLHGRRPGGEGDNPLPWAPLALDAPAPAARAIPLPLEDTDGLAEVRAFADEHRRRVAEATRPRVLAATTIASGLADLADLADPVAAPGTGAAGPEVEVAEDESTADSPEGQPWRRGRAGSAIGRAVHAVLQTVDLQTLDGLDDLAISQCAAEGLPTADAGKVASRVRRAAEVPIVAELSPDDRTWRELHVGAPLQVDVDGTTTEVVIEGFIDLLVEVGDDLVVVDWKTDATAGRTPEEVARRYHPQAATYALALEAALQRTVRRCVFVLTGVANVAERQVEVSGADLDRAKQELVAALPRLLRA